MSLHNYSIEDGLISDNIQSICQDSLGYIWIGTGEGISVFDSREFRSYSTINGLSSNSVTHITADRKNPGVVWIGTNGGGINKFVKGKFEIYGSNLPFKMKTIDALFEDDNNVLWCGSDSGLYFIQNNQVHFIPSTNELGSITSLAQNGSGKILIGSDSGLYNYSVKVKSLSRIILPKSNEPGVVALIGNTAGTIFALSESGYLYKINQAGVKDIYLDAIPRTIIEDDLNNLWVGTNNGIYKISKNSFSKNRITKYTTGNGLLENNVSSILYDREGILWIGANDNGISKLTYQNLFRFKIPKKYTIIWSSAVSDENGRFWVCLNKGLFEIWKDKNDVWHQHFHLMNYLQLRHVIPSMYCDMHNTLYIADQGVIFIYRIKQEDPISGLPSVIKLKEKIDLSEKFKFDGIYKIFADNLGNIWCSALNLGVVVISKSTRQLAGRNILKVYTLRDRLPGNSVREIFQDSKGNFWFGGYDGGLSVFSHGKILNDIQKKKGNEKIFSVRFTTSNGLPDNGVRAIGEYENGDIIIGTRYGGLAIYKDGTRLPDRHKFKIITKEEGLLSNAIWSLTTTARGNIWLGTQSGVQELDKKETPDFKLYEELPKEPYYSICSSPEGNLCFVDKTDIYIYQPSGETEKQPAPPVYISHLFINGQEQKIKDDIILPSNKNTITFEFTGIVNREEKGSHYLYRLLKIDKEWNSLINLNSITYASLNPGTYTFQVIAVNASNLKSIHPAKLTFTINAPFYEQWQFITIILILILLTIHLTARIRIKRLLEIEKMRTRIAADLHDEIGSGLTRIAFLSDIISKKTKSNIDTAEENYSGKLDSSNGLNIIPSVQRVGNIARELVDAMSDVVWSINPKHDSLISLIQKIKAYSLQLCENMGITLTFESSEAVEKINLPASRSPEILRSILLITKEALTNIVKHSHCTQAAIKIDAEKKTIHLTFIDDGCGFDLGTADSGNGLTNMQNRASKINGKIEIKSQPGKGTSISLSIPR
ncbi:MAG: ligand-binding sensor domain-containing protein [Ignavibacteriaceae bacterium]